MTTPTPEAIEAAKDAMRTVTPPPGVSKSDWLAEHGGWALLAGAVAAAAPFIAAQAKVEALAPILALHQPSQVWEYDDVNGVFKVDADGEQIPMHKLCIECTSEDVLEAVGDCDYTEGSLSGEVRWPCATYAAATIEGKDS